MDHEYVRRFEELCLQDEAPPCQSWCPLHLDARALAALAAEGRMDEARKVLDRHLPLSNLTGHLCEGPCRAHCRRSELDQGVDMPLLERLVVSLGRPAKIKALPKSGRAMAIIGAGLTSLVLAWELGLKGHRSLIHHRGPIGGVLRELSSERLPPQALETALNQLRALGVDFQECPDLTRETMEGALAAFDGLFIGLDDPAVAAESLGLTPAELQPDPVSLALGRGRCFAGPIAGRDTFSEHMAAGKRAAGSFGRLIQGVSPSAAREKEDVYPSRLYTNLEGATIRPPRRAANPLAPELDEGREEAGRCLQCQCLECVKKCVYLQSFDTYPKKAARRMYNNIITAFGVRTANTMINSCAECGLCGVVCPTGADLGAFCAAARRHMVAGRHMPASAHEFALEDQAFTNAPDIAFQRNQPGRERGQWLFFPGCQLPASLPAQTAALYEHLCGGLNGGVGFFLACCGAPARWSGRDGFTAQTAAFLRQTWEEAGRPTVIFACASCGLFFQAELPDIPLVSLWKILAELPPIPGAISTETLALHDPCASRRDEAARAGVRKIAATLGQTVEELPLGGASTRCCGYGGLADAANPALGEKYAQNRAGDSALPFLAYCAMCRDRLQSVGKPALHLLDLLFPAAPPAAALDRPAPGLSDRQETRRKFRSDILEKLWGEAQPVEEALPTLHIGPETARNMEARRILRRDVGEVIRQAEAEGAQFVNNAGRRLAALRPRQVTFWVEYSRRTDGSYEVHNAYTHRMVVPGVSGQGADTPATLEGHDPKGGRK